MKKKQKAFLFILGALFLVSCGKTEQKETEAKKTEVTQEVKTEQTAEISKPAENPYLAAPTYAITHFDSSQSDAFPYAVKTGDFHIDLKQEKEVTGNPINIMTLASTSPDYMWGVSGRGPSYINVANKEFKEVARIDLPYEKIITKEIHEEVLRNDFKSVEDIEKAAKGKYITIESTDAVALAPSATYSLVDSDNTLYTNYGTFIQAFALIDKNDPTKGIQEIRKFDTKKIFGEKSILTGLSLTYDGNLIILANNAIAVVDREFKNTPSIIKFGTDESISNSIAVDEKSGIYVASNKFMRKVVWTGEKLSEDEKDGAWKTEYDTGQQPPSVKFGTGTGSTPTLMGFGNDEDKLVVITDGADRMNIVAFWRDEIPADFKQQEGTKSNRIAGQMPITAGLPADTKWIQSEQSVVVNGYGAFVVNNIVNEAPKDRMVGVIALGPVIKPPTGVERVEWDTKANAWKSVWTRADVSSISMVPSMSRVSNIVFVNGYTDKDGWEITGMDWNTGKTVHRTIFGKDNFGNGAYATIEFFPDGDLLFNSIAGPFRVVYK